MLKEYRTITEVVGPLILVEDVEGATYNELVEIEQQTGEIRMGRVLEVDGDKAVVQLFEGSQGLQISTSKARFLGRSIELRCPPYAGQGLDGMEDRMEAPGSSQKEVDIEEPLTLEDYPQFIRRGFLPSTALHLVRDRNCRYSRSACPMLSWRPDCPSGRVLGGEQLCVVFAAMA